MPKMTSDIIIKDLVSMLGIKAVLHHDDDTAPFLSDWHSRYHGKAYAVALPETTDQVSRHCSHMPINITLLLCRKAATLVLWAGLHPMPAAIRFCCRCAA